MNHKKGLAIFLSIACAAILGSVFLLGKSPEHTFTPEVTESVSSNSWEERNSQTDSGHVMSKESADKTLPEDSSAEDPVQTVISEDTEQVITELTPIEDKAQVQANTSQQHLLRMKKSRGGFRNVICCQMPRLLFLNPPRKKALRNLPKMFPRDRTDRFTILFSAGLLHPLPRGRLLTMMEISISR